jgi:hypothetical protein
MILLKILVSLACILFLVLRNLNAVKEPFDAAKKPFNIITDWFQYNWDNVLLLAVGGVIGAFLSKELALPFIEKFLDWPELAASTIDLTAIAIMTLAGSWLCNFIISKAK